MIDKIICRVGVAWSMAESTHPQVITDFHKSKVYAQHHDVIKPLEHCLKAEGGTGEYTACEKFINPLKPFIAELFPELFKLQSSLGDQLKDKADHRCGALTLEIPKSSNRVS